jgi:hypothetical protein
VIFLIKYTQSRILRMLSSEKTWELKTGWGGEILFLLNVYIQRLIVIPTHTSVSKRDYSAMDHPLKDIELE